jgi:hypothetical protein
MVTHDFTFSYHCWNRNTYNIAISIGIFSTVCINPAIYIIGSDYKFSTISVIGTNTSRSPVAPTLRETSPSAAPSIPIITVFVPRFSISYVSPGATESPTEGEFELLWNATLEYMEQSITEFYGNQTDVTFLGLSGLLKDQEFELGLPEARFNLYIESEVSIFYTEDSNPPTLSDT